MYSTPAVAGYLLFVASCNGRMRALDKRTGQVKWEYDITKDGDQHEFHGDPLITDELVVIGTDGKMGHVYAFEQSTVLVLAAAEASVTVSPCRTQLKQTVG